MACVSIKFALDARLGMMRGVDRLADAVSVTLGPRGRTVAIEAQDGTGSPIITKDGVTVADALEEADRFDQLGLRLVRRAAQRVAEDIGDGTTTTIVLARAIVAEGLKAVSAGVDPLQLRVALERGSKEVIDELRRQSRPVRGREDLQRIAAISANGDKELGAIIGEAFDTVGADGVVSIEGGKSFDTTWERLTGLRWDGGYVSPYFMTDAVSAECVYENPLILLTEHTLDNHTALLRPLETAVRANRPLLIVAEAVTGEALQTLVTNKIRNNLRVVAGKGPLFGDRRRAMLEDIAAVTGATLVSDRRGDDLQKIDPAMLGSAGRIKLTKGATTIIGGGGKQVDIDNRISGIRAEQGVDGNTPFQEKNLRERLAKLVGGVAVVRVGGASDAEISERLDRADDAANAVRAAVAGGILPGGGAAYLYAAKILPDGTTLEERAANRILCAALASPISRIASNAGQDGRMIAAMLVEADNTVQGYDAKVREFCDLMDAGIVDAALVAVSALQAATSVAALLLTTEVVVAKPAAPPRPTRADEIPFGPEAKDMTADEAAEFGLV